MPIFDYLLIVKIDVLKFDYLLKVKNDKLKLTIY